MMKLCHAILCSLGGSVSLVGNGSVRKAVSQPSERREVKRCQRGLVSHCCFELVAHCDCGESASVMSLCDVVLRGFGGECATDNGKDAACERSLSLVSGMLWCHKAPCHWCAG